MKDEDTEGEREREKETAMLTLLPEADGAVRAAALDAWVAALPWTESLGWLALL